MAGVDPMGVRIRVWVRKILPLPQGEGESLMLPSQLILTRMGLDPAIPATAVPAVSCAILAVRAMGMAGTDPRVKPADRRIPTPMGQGRIRRRIRLPGCRTR